LAPRPKLRDGEEAFGGSLADLDGSSTCHLLLRNRTKMSAGPSHPTPKSVLSGWLYGPSCRRAGFDLLDDFFRPGEFAPGPIRAPALDGFLYSMMTRS